MSFGAQFRYTHSMVKALGRIEAARCVINVLPLPPDQMLLLRHQARQRATRNSTAIEGNTLNRRDVMRVVAHPERSKTDMEQEVRNYWRALDWIEEQVEANRPLTEDYVRELHAIIIVRGHGRRGTRSDYRLMECPVVDSATGAIDYGPPEPKDVPGLMRDLVTWLKGSDVVAIPAPVRAGLLAHRFVSIHPFMDGNGRTARALATAELWRSGYDMRGFLSLEEYYTANIASYYGNLQMGLPMSFYEGRHNPDHTQWLEYFAGTMADAADLLRKRAETLHPEALRTAPWESLKRIQQQLLSQILSRRLIGETDANEFGVKDLVEWFGVGESTAREWLKEWRLVDFVRPAREGLARIHDYVLAREWQSLVEESARNSVSNSDG